MEKPKILWKGSPANRGNITMVKGGIYDPNKFEVPVGQDSWDSWYESGLFLIIGKDVDVNGKPFDKEEEPKVEVKVEEKSEENIEKTTPEEIPEEKTEEPEIVSPVDAVDEAVKINAMNEASDIPKKTEETKTEEAPAPEAPLTEIFKDAEEFDCPYTDCYKHEEGYKTYRYFIPHMEDKHGEIWRVQGDKIVKTEG